MPIRSVASHAGLFALGQTLHQVQADSFPGAFVYTIFIALTVVQAWRMTQHLHGALVGPEPAAGDPTMP